MDENINSNENMDIERTRQPKDLKGLLHFAMQATKSEDAPNESNLQPMDPERRKFLEEALNSLTIDVIEELEKSIQTLYNLSTTKLDDQLYAIEIIKDFVDNIDTANDFYKIGGFVLLMPLLDSENEEIRVGGASLIAELAQNNPFCQQHLLELNILPRLIELISEKSEKVSGSALHAISCMIRGFEPGLQEFSKLEGFKHMLEVLNTNNEKGHVKVGFFINTLSSHSPIYRNKLIQLNAIEHLAKLLHPTEEYDARIEIILSAICTLCLNDDEGMKRLCIVDNAIQNKFEEIIISNKGKDDCEEIVEMCQKLVKAINDNREISR